MSLGREGKLESRSISTKRGPAPLGPYPHARRVGDLIFVSGIGPRDAKTNQIPGAKLVGDRAVEHDVARELKQCFASVRAILEDAGSSFERIVDVTVFLVDLTRDWEAYNKAYAEVFKDAANRPTRTTVGVSRLPGPIHVEVKVIATVG